MVEDNGRGMSAADLSRLFEPFVQLDSGLAKHFEGTGLGLAMVRRLAELHGGTVAVKSELGQGSSFAVWLPLISPSPTMRGARVEGEGVSTALPSPSPAMGGMSKTALVVEDDPAAAEFIRRVLEAEGLKVSLAGTAEAALTWLETHKPALVTLDILLPGMDGWDFLQHMEASPRLREVPVIVLSIVADAQRGFALGAAAVLQKPVGRAELLDTVTALVGTCRPGKMRVLIVDDDPRAVEIIAAFLPPDEFETLRAYGGREAIALARSAMPDLILLDLLMPEVSGFDVARELDGGSETATIPIVVVTSKLLDAADRAALNGHVSRIVAKAALDGHALAGEVRRALAGRKGT